MDNKYENKKNKLENETIVRNMIKQLKKLKDSNSKVINIIKNFDLLIKTLEELDEMVEMDIVKESIIEQLRFLLLQHTNNYLFEGHMLHTVIYGPPGVGKSKIGLILAKIWASLGILNNNNKNDKIQNKNIIGNQLYEKIIEKLDEKNKYTNEIIIDLQKYIMNQFNSIIELKKILNELEIPHNEEKSINNIITYIYNNIELSIKTINDEITTSNNNQLQINEIINDEFKYKINNENDNQKSSDDNIPFILANRSDIVGEYLGQTSIKTRKFLNDNRGKFIFFDEAYTLITSERDSFGMEAVTEIIKFMSEEPDSIIIGFAGYKNFLKDSIFKYQPGLERRCTWIFEIEGYTPKALSNIFKYQVMEYGWIIDPSIDLVKFFTEHKNKFPSYGGDTSKFLFYCKLQYCNHEFNEFFNLSINQSPFKLKVSDSKNPKIKSTDNYHQSRIITYDIMLNGLSKYNNNRLKDQDTFPCNHMYL